MDKLKAGFIAAAGSVLLNICSSWLYDQAKNPSMSQEILYSIKLSCFFFPLFGIAYAYLKYQQNRKEDRAAIEKKMDELNNKLDPIIKDWNFRHMTGQD